MSPEISFYKNRGTLKDALKISVPDQDGIYETELGKVEIDMQAIDPRNQIQRLKVDFLDSVKFLKITPGDFVFELSSEGRGGLKASGSFELMTAQLHKPIREKGQWKRVKEKDENGKPKCFRGDRVVHHERKG